MTCRRLNPRVLFLLPLMLLALTAAAVAYWTGTGAGSAQGRLGDPKTLVLSAGGPSALLYPGHNTDVAIIASNPNPYTVHIDSLVLDPDEGAAGFEVDGAHSGCDLSSLTFAPQSNGGAGWTVPPRSGASDGILALTLSDSLSMGAGASDACQGATFTVHLEAGS